MKIDLYSGSRLKMNSAMWPSYYEARLRLGGPLTTIAPIGDPLHANAARTTFTSVGDEQVVWTPTNSGLHLWATPLDLRQDSSWQGIIPCIKFDGSTDWIETPDASFWTDTAGTSEPSYTFIVYIKIIAGAAQQTLWAKTPIVTTAGTDWVIYVNTSELPVARFYDDSADAFIGRNDNSSLSATWHQVAITKSTGTTSAAISVYVDGAQVDDNDSESGTYVNQEDGTNVTRIGAESDGGNPLSSWIAGGPLGPLFTPGTVMSADAILRDYNLGRRALGI